MTSVQDVLQRAKTAKYEAAKLTPKDQNRILDAMAGAVRAAKEVILAANEKDIENAKGNIADVMVDRLRLTPERIEGMAAGIEAVRDLPTPVLRVESEIERPNGLVIRRVRVPLGVIAIIYESRPNVTTDAAALCVKSGNVCVLRGGKEAILSNMAVVNAVRAAIEKAGYPADFVQLVEDTDRSSAMALMEARGFVDLLIPRGGAGLIKAVVEGARGVPVIETGSGICHIYVDKASDLDMANAILYNAKTTRPSVCNSAEVCLVHRDVAGEFLPKAAEKLAGCNVELRLDERAAKLVEGVAAGPADFDTEFNDFVLAVAVVDSLDDAIRHVNAHSTGHSDAIVTGDAEAARRFTNEVDSAAVYHNASTRFTDGGEFGLGCEMGISTQKLGARGPMGLEEMTSYKYIVLGSGQVR